MLLGLTVIDEHVTVSVKFCTASGDTPLAAVNCSANVPDCVGVPASVPVPLPLSVNVTPVGGAAPVWASAGAGKPVVVTVKLPGEPAANVVLFALVIAGACLTISVKF